MNDSADLVEFPFDNGGILPAGRMILSGPTQSITWCTPEQLAAYEKAAVVIAHCPPNAGSNP